MNVHLYLTIPFQYLFNYTSIFSPLMYRGRVIGIIIKLLASVLIYPVIEKKVNYPTTEIMYFTMQL